jgi:hypothetical protein
MAAPEEHDSSTEALQPAVEEEEETKTFKDLVRKGDAWCFFCTAGSRLRQGSDSLDPG